MSKPNGPFRRILSSRGVRAAPLSLLAAGFAIAGPAPAPQSPAPPARTEAAPRRAPIAPEQLMRGIAVAVDADGHAHALCVEPERPQPMLHQELRAAENVAGHPLAYQ